MSSPELPLPSKFYEGIEQFNRQEFFEAHDTLESVWKDHKTQDRLFIQGIIQIAVGCHHLKQGNFEGALSLFRRGIDKLDHFKPNYGKVDIEKLTKSTSELQKYAEVAGKQEPAVTGDQRKIAWPHIMLR
jgi:uncharacterized protein